MKNSASDCGRRPGGSAATCAPSVSLLSRASAAGGLLALLMLAACGGGGGGGGPSSTTAYYTGSVAGTSSSNAAGLEGGSIVLKSNDGSAYTVSSLSGQLQLSVTGSAGAATTLSIDRHPINQLCKLTAPPTAVGSSGGAAIACAYTPINDTGLTACRPGSSCVLQDGGSGRDAFAANLGKVRSGAPAGFDYTRICNNGQAEGGGGCSLGASPVPGSNPGDWGCTRDNVTGLVWRVVDYPGRYAQGEVNQQPLSNWCGRSNWKIPSAEQLQSVMYSAGITRSATYSGPALIVTRTVAALTDWLPMFDFVTRNRADEPTERDIYISDLIRSGFWSVTRSKDNSDNAWAVQFAGAGRVLIGSAALQDKLRIAPVSEDDLPQRFSDSYHEHRFRFDQAGRWELPAGAPGTLIDRRSGLMWMLCSAGRTYNSTANRCDAAGVGLDFSGALAEAASVNAGSSAVNRGFTDWRIPSRAELASLIDYLQAGPAVSTDVALSALRGDLVTLPGSFWSSSWIPPSSGSPEEAFTVNFDSGEVSLTPFLSDLLRVRLVRTAR